MALHFRIIYTPYNLLLPRVFELTTSGTETMGNCILSILKEFSYDFFLKEDFTMKITSKYMVVQTRSGILTEKHYPPSTDSFQISIH
jgi:hypothetical protein